jgi:hypothetical protein
MGIEANVMRPGQVRRTIASKQRMFWVVFSWTGIDAVVMLLAGQSFCQNFFVGTVLPSIVDDSALSRPKFKASGTILCFDEARSHIISDKCDKFGIKQIIHPPYGPDL